MAVITRVELVDDLDGGEANETITFGLDGATYEIDLSESNAELLRDALAKYVFVARRKGGVRRAAKRLTPSPAPVNGHRVPATRDKLQREAVREWALANGLEVGRKGRIAQSVYDAFQAAHA